VRYITPLAVIAVLLHVTGVMKWVTA